MTDDDGATGTINQADHGDRASPAVLALDTFTRNVTNGFGAANTGGNWTPVSSTLLNVINGVGTMRVTTSQGPAAYLNTVSARDVDATVKVAFDKPGTGGGTYSSVVVRRIGTSDYRLKVRIEANAVTLFLVRTVNGTETTLANQRIPGLVYHARPGPAPAAAGARGRARPPCGPALGRRRNRADGVEPDHHRHHGRLAEPGRGGAVSPISPATATNSPVTASYDEFQVVPAGP